jgi:ribonuclease HII
MSPILGGADEAGRGPVLGPMVICAACFQEEDLAFLTEQGVKDSKQLTPKRRGELRGVIAEKTVDYELVVFEASEIDASLQNGTNLNELEAAGFSRAIDAIINRGTVPDRVWIDAVDPIPGRFGEKIAQSLCQDVAIEASHKADVLYVQVGAASILAKTRRDELLANLAEEYGDIGSGYPSDPKTRAYLKAYYRENGEFPAIARLTWDTVTKVKKELGILPKGQEKLF